MVLGGVVEHRPDINLERALLPDGRCNVCLRREGLVTLVDFISVDLDRGGELAAGEHGCTGELLGGGAREGRRVVGKPAVEQLEWEETRVVDREEFG